MTEGTIATRVSVTELRDTLMAEERQKEMVGVNSSIYTSLNDTIDQLVELKEMHLRNNVSHDLCSDELRKITALTDQFLRARERKVRTLLERFMDGKDVEGEYKSLTREETKLFDDMKEAIETYRETRYENHRWLPSGDTGDEGGNDR